MIPRLLILRLFLLAGALLGWSCAVAADLAKPSVQMFFSHADFNEVQLSPSGKYLAAAVPVQGRLRLAIVDLDAGTSRIALAIDGEDIQGIRWVNDGRLIFSLTDLQAGLGAQFGGGLFAVNRDGTELRELGPTLKRLQDANQFVYRYTHLLEVLDGSSDDILVLSNDHNPRFPDVYRLDTRTGRRELLTAGKPGDVVHWVADDKGAVRGAVTIENGTTQRVFSRVSADAAWVELGAYGIRDAHMLPLAFDADGTLLVASDIGRDTAAIYRYDAQQKALGEVVAAHAEADLTEGLVRDPKTRRIVGIHYQGERPGSAWFDSDWARLQKTVDTALPGHVNTIVRRGDRVLIDSFSDQDPGTYYLLDLDKRRIEPVGVRRKAIDPAAMPKRQFVRFKARDGLEIPAYLTLPVGKEAKGLPFVLYVHGGPWVRGGYWRWRPEPAYLASLGYAVLEPDFRGSVGWGRKLYLAGWKQWGLAMQDDLNDGMDWLAAQGTIDPKRACIMGASYGGYAVMMGLARDPDRWRCGVDYVGVTDINLMFDVTWSDMAGSDFIRYSAKDMIGDPDADAARLQATSPLRNAARISKPVLMAYGAADRRVPLIHGERMRDALTTRGVPVEWIVYPDEGHGFQLEANRFDFYERVTRFLGKALAAP